MVPTAWIYSIHLKFWHPQHWLQQCLITCASEVWLEWSATSVILCLCLSMLLKENGLSYQHQSQLTYTPREVLSMNWLWGQKIKGQGDRVIKCRLHIFLRNDGSTGYWHQWAIIKGAMPFLEESGGGWRKDEARILIQFLSFLCGLTLLAANKKSIWPAKTHPVISKDSLLEGLKEHNKERAS